ncbi:iron-sulfur cluster carrier protein [Terrihabitans soli]|uniref:Iron-sulfur cluster carrier protein n=1 Tax=Terrihabitans soli TaxID=708113 RepID=A0A6S6QTB3_9HYPH|nr:Mrp/NBP35 family ATP-binding protein [Terrihabitans soli]BCJ90311.1 iron-sulfur cluster carrier protein [Terrihabitans soli]
MTLSRDDILRALAAVPAPDGRGSLADSPQISEIAINDGRVSFAIQTTPDKAKSLETLRAAAEAAVKSVPGVTDVLVALTADRPAGASKASPQVATSGAEIRQAKLDVRHIIAIASGKGGVGKSTTAANIALALAGKNLRVGLLDADVYGPSVPILFGLTHKPESDGKIIQPITAYGIKLMSIGFLIDSNTAMVWRGPMVMSAITQMLKDVDWGSLDVLVVDMPPGTGDAQLTMAQQTRLSGAVIVSTPQDIALADARRGVAMFRKVDVPILGVVENMSYFCCPNCGTRTDIFGHGGAEAEAERLGVAFLGEIPLHARVRELSDAGTPIVAVEPESEHAKAYSAIADMIWTRLEAGTGQRAAPKIIVN